MRIGALAAAALVPPLGVHLAGAGARDVHIACALTASGFLPGAAFALYVVLSRRASPA